MLQEVCLVALNGAQLQVSADVTVSTSNIGQALCKWTHLFNFHKVH